MGKKGVAKKGSTPNSGYQCSTLREASCGRKHVKGFRSATSFLRMQHLQKLAVWAGGEASIPPLGALFGHHLAAVGEATGIPLDSSLFPCQRCETILQPGHNCTIRIKKNTNKTKCRKQSRIWSKNSVVYKCHFCSHENLKRGTAKGHMKEILSLRPKSVCEILTASAIDRKSNAPEREPATGAEIIRLKENPILESKPIFSRKEQVSESTEENSPVTPSEKLGMVLLEKNRKRRGSRLKNVVGNDNSLATSQTGNTCGGSSKRKRKTWSSLKEIAESDARDNSLSIGNLTIPFFT